MSDLGNKFPLGRRIPSTFDHIEKYPYAAIAPATPITVEKSLPLPSWHWSWDQGAEGACVGFGTSMMISIINQDQARATKKTPITRRYDPLWLWNQAKAVDEWPDTNPGDQNGTSVKAACDILRTLGHVLVIKGKDLPVDLNQGIVSNHWATKTDEMRTALSQGLPIAIGINWYTNFDTPKAKGGEHWIGEGNLGTIRGGHCVCVYGASDKRQAFLIKNSWGRSFPLVWMPYTTMQRLLQEQGEATLVIDR